MLEQKRNTNSKYITPNLIKSSKTTAKAKIIISEPYDNPFYGFE